MKTMTTVLAAVLLLLGTTGALAGFEEGMNYFKAGKYLEAVAEFQALVDESPEYDYGYFMLGVCQVKTGKPGDGERNFAKAIELNGDRFEYHFALANVYQKAGEYRKVISTLNTAEDLVPETHRFNFYQLRGFAEAAEKDWEASVDDLEKAAAIKSDPRILTQLGKAYFSLGEYVKSVDKFAEATRIKPEAESFGLMAEGLLNIAAKSTNEAQKKSRYDEAMDAAQKYVDLEPGSADARYIFGRAALGAGKYDQAIEAFSKVLDSKPDNCNAMANMGKAFIAKKNWANALQALNNATSCSPGMAVAWQNKAFVLQKQGSEAKSVKKYGEAIAAYEQADRLKPSPANAKGIETCRNNMDVIKTNQNIAELEKEQDEEIQAADEEFAAAQAKQEEWKKKTEEDD
jgi:tetratricopeptide (TPR) repeat protein